MRKGFLTTYVVCLAFAVAIAVASYAQAANANAVIESSAYSKNHPHPAAIPQADFPSVDAFLKSVLKGEDQLSFKATGDLNNDGLEDWAGVIQRRKSEAVSTNQLYVLLRQRPESFRVAASSQEAEIPGMGCCGVENLEIKRGSIYIQNNTKTGDTVEAATHQFKLYNGQWRLVGLKIFYLVISTDASTETDMNLLTGAVTEKRQKGEGRPAIKRSRKRFSMHLLKDFDFNNGFGAEQS